MVVAVNGLASDSAQSAFGDVDYRGIGALHPRY